MFRFFVDIRKRNISIISMSLSRVLVFLIMHQKWKNVLLIDANSQVGPRALASLSESGVPAASVDESGVERYPWPQKYDPRPRFDGFVLCVGRGRTRETMARVIGTLKGRSMVNPHQSWIISVEGCLLLDSIAGVFGEGDRILLVGSMITEKHDCTLHSFFQEFRVWSLHSIGNGSLHFLEKGYWSSLNQSEYLDEPLFDEPFVDFGGRVLRISSLGSPPVQEPPLPGQKRWRGYVFHIVNILSDIFNFTYVVQEAAGRLYGMEQGDGSWSGMMGELANKSVDLGVGDLSFTLDRSRASDLTETIFAETVTFIYRAPDFYSRTWILFQDIDRRIWISLCSIMTVTSLSYCFILFVSESRDERRRPDDSGAVFVTAAVRSVGSLYRAFLGQGITYHPSYWSCRGLLASWFLGSLVLGALYGGGLTSTLSLHRTPRPADSLRDLIKRHPDAILALRNNSQAHSIFMTSPYWRDVYAKNIRSHVIPGKYHIEDTMAEVHKKVPEGAPIYAWIGERSMLTKQMHAYSDDPSVCDLYVAKEDIVRSDWALALVRNSPFLDQFDHKSMLTKQMHAYSDDPSVCDLYVAKEDIVRSDWALALVRNSPFLDQFDHKILRLQRFGLLQKWHADHWGPLGGRCRPTDGRNPTGRNPISVADTQAGFLLLGLGWAVGWLALAAERGIQ